MDIFGGLGKYALKNECVFFVHRRLSLSMVVSPSFAMRPVGGSVSDDLEAIYEKDFAFDPGPDIGHGFGRLRPDP